MHAPQLDTTTFHDDSKIRQPPMKSTGTAQQNCWHKDVASNAIHLLLAPTLIAFQARSASLARVTLCYGEQYPCQAKAIWLYTLNGGRSWRSQNST